MTVLQSLIGIVKEPKLAAITQLAPQGSKILAKPPSLASITRDVYTRSSSTAGEESDTIVGPLSLSAVIAVAYAMANGLRGEDSLPPPLHPSHLPPSLIIIITNFVAALHDAGICHGDLYAHNILVEPSSM